ncbi:MAG: heparan-alpha-glucosaminide N-acetyltransferase domain-containing protein [Culicoidibacterales bacterium]
MHHNDCTFTKRGGATIFTEKPSNTGRQLELDIARGLAVLFMIVIHVQLMYATFEVNESWFGTINDYFGGVPAAPMFMFLLGVGIVYSQSQTWQKLLKRGLYLLILAYGLNFLRGFLPQFILANIYPEYATWYFKEAVIQLTYVDILQFSGLALITFSIFNRWQWHQKWFIVLIVACSGLQLILRMYPTENIFIGAVTGLFYGANEFSYFPYLTWIFYPVAGFIFGNYLIRCQDKQQWYRQIMISASVVSLALIVIFNILLGFPHAMETDARYYHHGLIDQLTYVSILVIELGGLYYILQYIPNWLVAIAKRWSRNVTAIFCVHWVILTWLGILIPQASLTLVWFLLLTFGIVLVSDWLGQRLQKYI